MIDSLQTENVLDCDNDHYVCCWLLVTWHVSPGPQSVQWNNATHQQLTKLAIFSLDIFPNQLVNTNTDTLEVESGVITCTLWPVMIWPHQPPAQAEGNWQVHVLASAAVSSKLTRPGIDQLQQCPVSRCSVKTSVWESSEDGAHELLLQSARTENCSLWKAAKIIPRNSDCLWLVAVTLFD